MDLASDATQVVSWWQAIIFGLIEGVTEFLPVSSTAHLTITEKLFGFKIDSPDITAFTAIIQVGAVLATVIYFRKDFFNLARALVVGLLASDKRDHRYKMAWAVVIGSIPIAIVGLLFKDAIETTLRSLWVVGAALIVWSFVLYYADRKGTQVRHEADVNRKDTIIIGIAQCLALIPGISRSGATLSAGLLRELDRVTVTRLSFFLSVPALVAAAILQSVTKFNDISNGVGWGPTLLALAVSFVSGYVAVAWLLKFISCHDYRIFVIYRIVLGIVVLALVATGTIAAT